MERSSGQQEQRPGGQVQGEDIETFLKHLPGILSARLNINSWGGIQEIHVLATTERGAKQVVRDVESALIAQWGINVDHKKISVAQVAQSESAFPPIRLNLLGFAAHSDTVSGRYQATVELCLEYQEEIIFRGSADGVNVASQFPRIVGAAVMNALNQAVREGHRFLLEDATVLNLAGRKLAVALFVLHGPRGKHMILSGAVPVIGDPVDAVIKACLQGSNRVMEQLLSRNPSPADTAQTRDVEEGALDTPDGSTFNGQVG